METTKGLPRRSVRFFSLLLPIFLLAACSRQEAADTKAANDSDEKSKALEQWRAKREAAKANAEAEASTPKPANTNTIDPVKAKKSIDSFSSRLKTIVGDSFHDEKELRAKAEAGDAKAQAELAVIMARQGDFAAAMQWNLKAAEQGNTSAQHALGVAYVVGQGASIDYAEAVKWFTRAAEQGDIDSQYSLGVRYAKGDHVQQNFTEAVKWFTLAANQGQPDSQVSLARRYMNGEGVQKDVVEAYKWAAAAGEYWSAPGVREQLEKVMTPDQITEGQKRADAFKPVKTGSK